MYGTQHAIWAFFVSIFAAYALLWHNGLKEYGQGRNDQRRRLEPRWNKRVKKAPISIGPNIRFANGQQLFIARIARTEFENFMWWRNLSEKRPYHEYWNVLPNITWTTHRCEHAHIHHMKIDYGYDHDHTMPIKVLQSVITFFVCQCSLRTVQKQ